MADPYTEAQKSMDTERNAIIQKIRDMGLEVQVLRLINHQRDGGIERLEDA